jgi:hypothetical protein
MSDRCDAGGLLHGQAQVHDGVSCVRRAAGATRPRVKTARGPA